MSAYPTATTRVLNESGGTAGGFLRFLADAVENPAPAWVRTYSDGVAGAGRQAAEHQGQEQR